MPGGNDSAGEYDSLLIPVLVMANQDGHTLKVSSGYY